MDHLDELEAEAIFIMREVVAECEKPVMLYSIGKDSSVMLQKQNPYLYDDLIRVTGAVCERLYKENRILEKKLDQALSDIAK